MRLLPGTIVCVLLAALATLLGSRLPIVGAPVFAILMGVALAAWRAPAPTLAPGISFASKTLLQASIVLLGANLSLAQIVRGGSSALPVMLGTFVLVLLLAVACGRILGLDRELRRLIGIGTAICGGSAIAAVASVSDVDRSDVAYALGTVFFFNVIAVLAFPPIGHALALSQTAFGLWAGTAINDTSSVVAAAFAYGHEAGNGAVVVKLTRTLLIVPIVLFYGWRRIASSRASGHRIAWLQVFPWFILWFLAAAAAETLGLVPGAWREPLQRTAVFTIVVALAGVGLSSDVARMRSAGLRPLVLGAILWISIATSSLAIAHVTNAPH
ncbi:MAG TPA: putative sulfate exporter family transporter [Candidatus Tumulicola sp.]